MKIHLWPPRISFSTHINTQPEDGKPSQSSIGRFCGRCVRCVREFLGLENKHATSPASPIPALMAQLNHLINDFDAEATSLKQKRDEAIKLWEEHAPSNPFATELSEDEQIEREVEKYVWSQMAWSAITATAALKAQKIIPGNETSIRKQIAAAEAKLQDLHNPETINKLRAETKERITQQRTESAQKKQKEQQLEIEVSALEKEVATLVDTLNSRERELKQAWDEAKNPFFEAPSTNPFDDDSNESDWEKVESDATLALKEEARQREQERRKEAYSAVHQICRTANQILSEKQNSAEERVQYLQRQLQYLKSKTQF